MKYPVQIMVRVDEELRVAAMKKALLADSSLSRIIRILLKEWLEQSQENEA